MKFRENSVIVEAEQWAGNKDSWDKRMSLGLKNWKPGDMGSYTFTIETLDGDYIAILNDWIIKNENGEFHPCKPEFFKKTYEKVDD